MDLSDDMKFNFRVQARARLSLETYGWYPYVRIYLNDVLYAEFSGEGIVEFETPVWAQGIADMILDAEMLAAERAIQVAADYLKDNTFGDGS